MSAPVDSAVVAVLSGTGPEATYRGYLRAGRFMIQRGLSSGRHVFYPRTAAPATGEALEWVEASGRGVVYATTVVRQRPEAGGDYNISIVELAEGPRTMSHVVGISPGDVRIGMTVQARIDEQDGEPLLVFVATGGQGE